MKSNEAIEIIIAPVLLLFMHRKMVSNYFINAINGTKQDQCPQTYTNH